MPLVIHTLLLLAASCNALLFESVALPRGWQLSLDEPVPSQLLKLELGLAQPLQAELEARLEEISSPDHPDYGQHLSLEQLQAYTRPSNASVAAVTQWLQKHQGVESFSFTPSDSFVSVTLPLWQAERMLNTKFGIFKHENGAEILRTLETHLPEDVHSHISVIAPTTYFDNFRHHASQVKQVQQVRTARLAHAGKAAKAIKKACPKGGCTAAVEAACVANAITPACLQAVYNVNYTPKVPKKQNLAVTGYLEQYFNIKDLNLFEKYYSPKTSKATTSVVLVNKGKNPQSLYDAGIEADLDMQYISSMAYPIHSTFYSTGGRPPFKKDANTPENDSEPYLNFLNYMLAQKSLPSVISTSYGDDEQTVPLSYAKKVCALYAQLGARGVTVLHSSGDGGATGASQDGYCLTNGAKSKTRFLATFPASCPYVTSVGATQPDPTTGFKDLVVAPYSSGGFSEYFKAPSWQSSAIKDYFKKSGTQKSLKGLFNEAGRGFPDVSLMGTFYAVVQSGRKEQVWGTSCSTPVFAAMVALLNDKRLAAGKPILGYINPWLFKTGRKAFKPISKGWNSGCGTTFNCEPTNCLLKGKPLYGFPAVGSTWSPGVGLGSPSFAKLLELV